MKWSGYTGLACLRGREGVKASPDTMDLALGGTENHEAPAGGHAGCADKGTFIDFPADQPIAGSCKNIIGMSFHAEGSPGETSHGKCGGGGHGSPRSMIPVCRMGACQPAGFTEGKTEAKQCFLEIEKRGTGVTEQVRQCAEKGARSQNHPIGEPVDEGEQSPFIEPFNRNSLKFRFSPVDGYELQFMKALVQKEDFPLEEDFTLLWKGSQKTGDLKWGMHRALENLWLRMKSDFPDIPGRQGMVQLSLYARSGRSSVFFLKGFEEPFTPGAFSSRFSI